MQQISQLVRLPIPFIGAGTQRDDTISPLNGDLSLEIRKLLYHIHIAFEVCIIRILQPIGSTCCGRCIHTEDFTAVILLLRKNIP